MMSSHCLMYLPSDFGFLFLLKEDLPMLSFVSPWIVLYIWIFRRCMNLFVISTSWREVTCWRRLGALESDCLCSVPALTCDLYSHHVSYMKLPHLWNRAVAHSSPESDSIFMRWHHTISHMWEVTLYHTMHVDSAQWNGSPFISLILLSALRPSSRTQRLCR